MSGNHQILLESGTNELELIEFKLHYLDKNENEVIQNFGINVTKVREIMRKPVLNSLPETPDGVVGMLNLRDQIIPILDLGHYLFGESATGETERLIISEFNGIRVGFMVNSVSRIHRISWESINPPTSITNVDPNHSTVVGLTTLEEKTILIIDVEEIVARIEPALAMQAVEMDNAEIGSAYTILTAEDSHLIRKMIFDQLNSVGFNIVSANNGKEAWKKLKNFVTLAREEGSITDHVDLVITDIEMPQMDGYTLTKNIKEHEMLKELPVIIFSSMVSEENKHKGTSVGADAQLTKPEIVKLIDTALSLLPEKAVKAVPIGV